MAAMPARGRYESHYLRAVDPARPRGAWIRYTTFRAPGRPPASALWCTVFDAAAGRPYAVKRSFGAQEASGGEMTADRARGTVAAGGRRAVWDLEIAGRARPLRHLGRGALYRAPLPRTKLESPRPDAVFGGAIELGGAPEGDARRVEAAGWRGMTGHNWGSEHAAQWVWLHGTAFADEPGAWLDVALGRVRIGSTLTPWIANGGVSLGGRRHRIGGLTRPPRVDARPGALEADLHGPGVRVRVTARAPAAQTVAFVYADPSGHDDHEVLNCSLAELHVRVERAGRPVVELATPHGGAYELGLPAGTPHDVPLEPFPDP
jgi:hypothetical protein